MAFFAGFPVSYTSLVPTFSRSIPPSVYCRLRAVDVGPRSVFLDFVLELFFVRVDWPFLALVLLFWVPSGDFLPELSD